MMSFNRQTWKWYHIGLLILVWRVGISMVSLLAINTSRYQPTFPYYETLLKQFGERPLTTWAQFDGVHYLTIVNSGYVGTGLIQAFFPFYPLMVRYVSIGVINPIVTGVVVSTLCFGIGLYFLHRLIRLDETESVARRALILILFAPVSFYFTSFYTEGLFFLLLVGSFYAARIGKWWHAGVLGALAALTRLVGVFLVPALLYEYFAQRNKVNIRMIAAGLPLAGLGSYMAYLAHQFKDPLLFYHVQTDFGAQRETNHIILPYQVIYRYIKMFLTVPVTNRLYFIVAQEFVAGLFGLLGLIAGWFITRPSYVIFGVLAYLVPTLTGTFSSLPRYLLPVFPLYIVVVKVFPKWLFLVTILISSIILIINLIYFTQGLWVS